MATNSRNTNTNATTNTNTFNNNNNNLFNDMNNSDILFINILNTMYNDNLRIIHHLMDQNSEITCQLIDVMNNRRQQTNPGNPANPGSNLNNRSYNRRYRNNNHTTQSSNINSNNTTSNTANTQRRVYVDNIPYYVDNLQLFTIPNSRSNTNTNTTIGNHFSRILNSFLDPINIIPTQSQIENATRTIVYGDILDPINTSCPISLEGFTDTSNVIMIRHCRHIFNTNSLMSWFNSNCKCPVCRYDIRDYNPNDNTQNEEQEEQEENEELDNNNNNNQTNLHTNVNTNTNTNTNNNSIEALFVEILTDLSNNDIEYTLDNTSQLFNSLFPINRRRESRR